MGSLSSLVVPPWLKIGVKLLPYAVIAVLAIALAITRGTLHDVRLNDKVDKATTAKLIAEDKAANAEDKAKASEAYAEKLQSIQPIILHNKETVREYSQTPAGAAPCLSSDRVSGIDGTRRELFRSTEAGDTQVRPDASPVKP